MYGVREDRPLSEAAYDHSEVDFSETFDLADRRLVRIDRLRLLTEPECPFMDLSYCYGTLRNGRHVPVDLGVSQFNKRTYKSELVEAAKAAGRYGKGMGMFDALSILWG